MANIHIESARCTGCMNCQTVCSLVHFKRQAPSESAVRVILDLFGGCHTHVYCRQCSNPACSAACPQGAINPDPDTGALVVDRSLCILCGSCVDACPFQAIFLSPSVDHAIKCDLCSGKPECVEACLFNVIELRD